MIVFGRSEELSDPKIIFLHLFSNHAKFLWYKCYCKDMEIVATISYRNKDDKDGTNSRSTRTYKWKVCTQCANQGSCLLVLVFYTKKRPSTEKTKSSRVSFLIKQLRKVPMASFSVFFWIAFLPICFLCESTEIIGFFMAGILLYMWHMNWGWQNPNYALVGGVCCTRYKLIFVLASRKKTTKYVYNNSCILLFKVCEAGK